MSVSGPRLKLNCSGRVASDQECKRTRSGHGQNDADDPKQT